MQGAGACQQYSTIVPECTVAETERLKHGVSFGQPSLQLGSTTLIIEVLGVFGIWMYVVLVRAIFHDMISDRLVCITFAVKTIC